MIIRRVCVPSARSERVALSWSRAGELAVGVPTFGQTAHATTRFSANSEIGGAVVVFDESPAGVITKGAVTQITIAAIATSKRQARCVTAEGATLWGVEADRRDVIDKVVAMIGAAVESRRPCPCSPRSGTSIKSTNIWSGKGTARKCLSVASSSARLLKLVREWLNSARGDVDAIGEMLVET